MHKALLVLTRLAAVAAVAATCLWWTLYLRPSGSDPYDALPLIMFCVLVRWLADWMYLAAVIMFVVWAVRLRGVAGRLVRPMDGLVIAWWSCYLVSVVAAVVVQFADPPLLAISTLLDLTPTVWGATISAVTLIPVAVLAPRVVRRVTEPSASPAPAA